MGRFRRIRSMPYSDPEAQRSYQREWLAARRRQWLEEHGPCVDCKTWDELEVDHVDSSTKVTHRVWSWSKARREAELAKCVVRCAACHDAKTTASRERPNGERNGQTHLTAADVREIRTSSDSERTLARRYRIANSTAHRIKVREDWKYLDCSWSGSSMVRAAACRAEGCGFESRLDRG